MKRIIIQLAVIVGMIAPASAQSNGKVFIYINSHNEDNIGYLNGPGGYNIYQQGRNALVQMATMTQNKGAKQNWGSDWVALKAIARYDTGSTVLNTNGKNLARWMSEDRGVECDPHSHESSYNCGTVAFLMDQLGVPPSGNISGFLFGQLQNGNNWEDYEDGIQSDSVPSYTWHPDVLWGGGSPNHVDDLNYYGCYKPKSMAEVNVHDPAKHLSLVGTGCVLKLDDTSTVAYNMSIIHRLLDAIADGTLPQNGIYTQEIMCNEGNMRQPYFLPLLSEMIDSVNLLVAQQQLEWAHLSEIKDYWKNSYDSIPFIVDCDLNTVIGLTTVDEADVSLRGIQLYPNPTSGLFTLQIPINQLGQVAQVFDLSGRQMLSKQVVLERCEIDLTELPASVYQIRIGTLVTKVIKL